MILGENGPSGVGQSGGLRQGGIGLSLKEERGTESEIMAHHGHVGLLGLAFLPPARQWQKRLQSFWTNDNWQGSLGVVIILS